MKKSIVAIKVIIFFVVMHSCSTTPNNNGGDNSTSVPFPPSSLTGFGVTPTQVNLSWTDNSTNETGFKIERRIDGGSFTLLGTVGENVYNFTDPNVVSRTTYTYRVYSYNSIGNSPTYTNEFTITAGALPIVSTIGASGVTSVKLMTGGNVVDSGLASVIERGVVWNSSSNPTIVLTTRTQDGSGVGGFTSIVDGMLPNTTYYIRAYARNSLGTGYGNEIVINTPPVMVDVDGNVYPTFVDSCTGKIWTAKELKVSKFRNGESINDWFQISDSDKITTPTTTWLRNDSANFSQYGRVYNWLAINDPRGIAPIGWHIATADEWNQLINCYGGSSRAGGPLKETGTSHWLDPNVGASNWSGFTALPCGRYTYLTNGNFLEAGGGSSVELWSATEVDSLKANSFRINSVDTIVINNQRLKPSLYSVRLVKD